MNDGGKPTAEEARAWLAEYARRQGANELLCKPPKPLSVLNAPVFSHDEAAEIISTVRDWMRQTAARGGPQDLQRMLARWSPYNPKMRSVLRGDSNPENFDVFFRLATRREIEMLSIVEVADSAENAKRTLQHRADAERAAIAKEQKALDQRKRALKQLEGRP